MESLYSKCIDLVIKGARFNINFEKRFIKINKKYLMKDGVSKYSIDMDMTFEKAIDTLNSLYDMYRHSVPTAHSENTKSKTYFIALSEEELSDEDMLYGISRDVAKVELEAAFLILVVNGIITWEKLAKKPEHFFWKSDIHKDFVILREWVRQ